MPTYEYACRACGHRFEEWQQITADPITKCPSCGKKKVERLLGTGGALLFKGSGFYITDYRSEGYKKAAKSDSSSSSSPARSDAGTSSSESSAPSKSESSAGSGESGASSPAPAAGDAKSKGSKKK